MFRENRRKNKVISTDDALNLLKSSRRGVLAVNGDDNYPYAIPINYLYDQDDNKIYFHGARVGHKAESIEKCDKVCFTVFGNETIKDLEWAPYLQSVVVFGRCRKVKDSVVSDAKLRQFAMKYYPDEKTVELEIAKSGKAVQMYEIEIEHLTGKQIQEL